MMTKNSAQLIGWREWLALPDIGLPGIKAKIDTGARTSALHAYFVEPFQQDRVDFVRFGVHPLLRKPDLVRICQAPVKECRQVTDSGGHREERYVIETTIQLGRFSSTIELTLTNRDTMKFRMLLGRSALQQMGVLVDSTRSYLLGPSLRRAYTHPKLEGSE
jgi:hypothetical protein